MDARVLRPVPLTPEAFEPYGVALGRPPGPPDIAKGWLDYWHDLAPIAFAGQPVWGFLEVHGRPFVLEELERHCRSQEVFIPTGGGRSVMAFACGGSPDDPGAAIDMDTLALFYLDGSWAVCLERGVWHTPAFPLGESAGFLLALEYATPTDDLDVRAIEPIEIQAG